MKNLITFFCLFLFLFFSCNTSDENILKNELDGIKPGNSLAEMIETGGFKKDFICANAFNVDHKINRKNKKWSKLLRHMETATKSYQEGDQHYFAIKKEMEELHNGNERAFHSSGIQAVALRYLRYHFLEENSDAAIRETKYLLGVLMEHHAVDLDILVDAYLKVKSELDEQSRKRYYARLVEVYNDLKREVEEKAIAQKGKTKNAGSELELQWAMVGDAFLNQKSNTVSYAKERMGW